MGLVLGAMAVALLGIGVFSVVNTGNRQGGKGCGLFLLVLIVGTGIICLLAIIGAFLIPFATALAVPAAFILLTYFLIWKPLSKKKREVYVVVKNKIYTAVPTIKFSEHRPLRPGEYFMNGYIYKLINGKRIKQPA